MDIEPVPALAWPRIKTSPAAIEIGLLDDVDSVSPEEIVTAPEPLAVNVTPVAPEELALNVILLLLAMVLNSRVPLAVIEPLTFIARSFDSEKLFAELV